MLYNGGEIGKSDNNSSSRIGSDKLYKRKAEPMLNSSSDSYSLLNSILVKASSTLFIHLTLSTNYLIYQLLL